MSLLLRFGWRKFVVVTECGDDDKKFARMTSKLQELSEEHNLTVTKTFEYDRLQPLHHDRNEFVDIVRESSKITRGERLHVQNMISSKIIKYMYMYV